MVARLLLTLVQIGTGWQLAPFISQQIPWPLSQLGTFLLALVFAVVVWIVGLAGSLLVRALPRPTLGTLSASVVFALAGAALSWIPPLTGAIDGALKMAVPHQVYPLAGAIIGYMARR